MRQKDRVVLKEQSNPCTIGAISADQKTAELLPHGITVPLSLLPSVVGGQQVRLTFTVENPHSREEWSRGYAEQARSDLEVYELLKERKPTLACHWLHYLQMAGEKLAKAWVLKNQYTSLEKILGSHTAASLKEFVTAYFKDHQGRSYKDHQEQLRIITVQLGHLADRIQNLAPAADPEKHPQNTEYPWSNGITLFVPCRQPFFEAEFDPLVWKEFVRTLRDASEDLAPGAATPGAASAP